VEAQLENYSKAQLIVLLQQQKKHASKSERKADQLEKEKVALTDTVAYLKYQIDQLKRLAFGQKRERFEGSNSPQLAPPFEEPLEAKVEREEDTKERITYERKKKNPNHHGRQPLPEHLPVEEIEIHPEGDLSDMVCIGKEVTDELEYTPASYHIKRYIRYKYAAKNKEGVLIGNLPARVIDKGIAGPGLLASILVDKYVDHLPLYRQQQRFKRENIPIASSTLEGWTRQSLDILDILYQHLLKETKNKGYLQVDETTIKVLDKDKKGKCHRGYYWVYHSPIDKIVLFDYQSGRSSQAPTAILENFKGYLQSDGYAVYNKIGDRQGVTHLHCWAHARREFEKTLSTDKKRAEIALLFIQSLYAVEAEARKEGMDADQRKAFRLDKALPTINAYFKWISSELLSGKLLPQNPIRKAMQYSASRRDSLSAYLYDGLLEIDNNLVENAIRPLAIGRKNYLFAGSHEAAQRAACIYSFFAICKKHEVNPYQWLKHTLENILDTPPKNYHTLYPQNFKQVHTM